jgi:hypothetical protein
MRPEFTLAGSIVPIAITDGENGMEEEEGRAAVHKIDLATRLLPSRNSAD